MNGNTDGTDTRFEDGFDSLRTLYHVKGLAEGLSDTSDFRNTMLASTSGLDLLWLANHRYNRSSIKRHTDMVMRAVDSHSPEVESLAFREDIVNQLSSLTQRDQLLHRSRQLLSGVDAAHSALNPSSIGDWLNIPLNVNHAVAMTGAGDPISSMTPKNMDGNSLGGLISNVPTRYIISGLLKGL